MTIESAISVRFIETPLGVMRAEAMRGAIRALSFFDASEATTDSVRPEDAAATEALESQLGEYFTGARRDFDIPLAPAGTDFRRRVWDALRDIPFGETIAYGQLARRVGNGDAVRAAAGACGANPIPIVIPCHRVVGADGSLTGFSAGIERKRALLSLERGEGLNFRSDQAEAGSFAAAAG